MKEYPDSAPKKQTNEQVEASLRKEIREGIKRVHDLDVRRSVISAAFEIADRQLRSADVQSDFVQEVCNSIPEEERMVFIPILASIAGLSRNLDPLKDFRTFLEGLKRVYKC